MGKSDILLGVQHPYPFIREQAKAEHGEELTVRSERRRDENK